MGMEFDDLTINEMKSGYRYKKAEDSYVCTQCGKEFMCGEVYPFNERFFDYRLAVKHHVSSEHGNRFDYLVNMESKYVTFTENQKNILSCMNEGLSDSEIAKKLGVTSSTIRHQKFMFREKAKQAKMYLAVYELALMEDKSMDRLIPIHDSAKMVDDRYITTNGEEDKILKTHFVSMTPLKLGSFPAREKKKVVVLKKITELFQKGKEYEEAELNCILKEIFDDFPTLRRYLIEYGFMDRTKDCKKYWLK